jgi:ribosomal protein L32E
MIGFYATSSSQRHRWLKVNLAWKRPRGRCQRELLHYLQNATFVKYNFHQKKGARQWSDGHQNCINLSDLFEDLGRCRNGLTLVPF